MTELLGTNLVPKKLTVIIAAWATGEFLRLLTVQISVRRKQGGLDCYLRLLIIACQFHYERRLCFMSHETHSDFRGVFFVCVIYIPQLLFKISL